MGRITTWIDENKFNVSNFSENYVFNTGTPQVIKMGKKNKKINEIKYLQDPNPTFVSDPLRELMMQYVRYLSH
jgi:hypothetical protein